MRYAIKIEKAANNYSAYVTDLAGCVATVLTIEEAIAFSSRKIMRGRFTNSGTNNSLSIYRGLITNKVEFKF
jgi:hypothetical protein